jgi:CubicO group peptidase (beta-lactamase class C family)
MRKLTIIIISIILFQFCTSLDQEGSRFAKRIDPMLLQIMERYDLPGLAVGVVKDNRIIYMKAFGYKNIETKEPLTVYSDFHQASNGKPFTATAIMQFVERGKVKLGDPVVKHLTYFKIDDERYQEITIRQMLNHTSGMPDDNNYEWDKPQYDDGALERYVRSLADQKLLFSPGERFGYSNMAYEVLGDLVAKVSGMTFEDYVQKNILNPLGMNNSTFLITNVNPKRETAPHTWQLKTIVSDIYPYNRARAPSSCLHSNIPDMCRWAITNMNKGSYHGKQILKPESYDILWELAKLNNGEPGRTGLSWFISEMDGRKMITHGGNDLGYFIGFAMIPERSIAVVTMSNCDFAFWGQISNKIIAILLGKEPQEEKIPVYFLIGKTISEKGLDAGIKLFRGLKENESERYFFGPGGVLNQIAYQFIQMNRIDDAITMLQLNIETFPEHGFSYARLGDLYKRKRKEELAISAYKKALELNPGMESAKKALEELQRK